MGCRLSFVGLCQPLAGYIERSSLAPHDLPSLQCTPVSDTLGKTDVVASSLHIIGRLALHGKPHVEHAALRGFSCAEGRHCFPTSWRNCSIATQGMFHSDEFLANSLVVLLCLFVLFCFFVFIFQKSFRGREGLHRLPGTILLRIHCISAQTKA